MLNNGDLGDRSPGWEWLASMVVKPASCRKCWPKLCRDRPCWRQGIVYAETRAWKRFAGPLFLNIFDMSGTSKKTTASTVWGCLGLNIAKPNRGKTWRNQGIGGQRHDPSDDSGAGAQRPCPTEESLRRGSPSCTRSSSYFNIFPIYFTISLERRAKIKLL